MTRMLLVAPYFRPSSYGGAVQLYHQTLVRLQSIDAVVVSQRLDRGNVSDLYEFDQSCQREYGYGMRRVRRFEFNFKPGTALSSRMTDAARFFVEARADWHKVLCDVRPD